MGLDMYLEAERTVAGDQADAVRAALAANPYVQEWNEEDPLFYVPRWNHMGDEVVAAGTAMVEAAGLLPLLTESSSSLSVRENPSGSLVVSMTVAYWRKANAVHDWFVERAQGGNDDCGRYVVHPEVLMALRAESTLALEAYLVGDRAKAAEILTPTAGFFFGSTEVDQYYAQDLSATVGAIDRMVPAAIEAGNIEFYYQSSW